MHRFQDFEAEQIKEDVAQFIPGDTVRVNFRVVEGEKSRIQGFEGICIGRQGKGVREVVTVRKISYGVGVERKFFLHSPNVDSISVIRQGRVRRAKLYYLRDRVGKKARVPQKKR